MAKSKEQKYKEAVLRNIDSNRHYIRNNHQYIGMWVLKHKLGIRNEDNQFDHVLEKLCIITSDDDGCGVSKLKLSADNCDFDGEELWTMVTPAARS